MYRCQGEEYKDLLNCNFCYIFWGNVYSFVICLLSWVGLLLNLAAREGDRTNHSRIRTMKNRTLAVTLGTAVITTAIGLGVNPASAAPCDNTQVVTVPYT